ncbi:MAG: hypothetical protein GXP61_05275 [Epsilonproteobacteria bacterium]|nr:hypothetical protein [Campylobacterota bacterium]
MKTKKFFKLLTFEIIVISAILAYFLIDSSYIYKWYVGSTNFVKQDKQCDLHKNNCKITLKDGSMLELSIYPKSIPLKKPIKLVVTTKNINLKTLSLKLYATNMNMGFIEKKLKKVGQNRYETSVILPSCMTGGMIWNANIIANKPTKSLGGVFEWTTAK